MRTWGLWVSVCSGEILERRRKNMVLAEYGIIDELTKKSERELLEVAKSLVKQTKYIVIECVTDLYDLSDGIMKLKSAMNILDTNEIGDVHSKMALVMGEDLGEKHLKISVKFYDDTPVLSEKIYC